MVHAGAGSKSRRAKRGRKAHQRAGEDSVGEGEDAAQAEAGAGAGGLEGQWSTWWVATAGDSGLVRLWAISRGAGDGSFSVSEAARVRLSALLASPSKWMGSGELVSTLPGTTATSGAGQAKEAAEAPVSEQVSCMRLSWTASSRPGGLASVVLATRDRSIAQLDFRARDGAKGGGSKAMGASLSMEQAAAIRVRRVIVGHSDEVLSVGFTHPTGPRWTNLPAARRLDRAAPMLVAANSPSLRLVSPRDFGVQLLMGHTATIVCVAPSPDGAFGASGCKGGWIRVWCLRTMVCIAAVQAHDDSVTALTWPSRAGPFGRGDRSAGWIVSAGADGSVKRWDLAACLADADAAAASGTEATQNPPVASADCVASELAHSKGVNAVAVSPNDRVLAVASQDKTVSIWDAGVPSTSNPKAGGLARVGVLKGHRRGVWCCEFSPIEQIVVTGSSDKTIRCWNARTMQCMRTLEGHGASVL